MYLYIGCIVIDLYNYNRNNKNFKKLKMQLFEQEYGKDNSEKDETEITTMLLYFSKEQLLEFKKLCKIGMKKFYSEEELLKSGNITDFLINQLRQKYENT
jgi:hypothetical protein